MKYFYFMVENTDDKGEKTRRRVRVTSKHLGGAIRKLYQSIDHANLVRIL